MGFVAGGIIASSLIFFFCVREGRKEKAGRLSQKAYVVVVAVRCELSKPWLQYQVFGLRIVGLCHSTHIL